MASCCLWSCSVDTLRGESLLTSSVVYCSEFLATDAEVRVRFLALPDFLRSSGPGTGSGGSPTLLSNGYRRRCPRKQSDGVVKLTIGLQPVPQLIIRGCVQPLPPHGLMLSDGGLFRLRNITTVGYF
jgi:hypothetical protein